MKIRTRVKCACAVMLVCSLCASAQAAPFGLFKVADTSTPIPNGTGNFTGFDHAPTFSGGGVAFRGLGAGQEGIYLGGSTPLQRAVDRNTIMPGTASPFQTFGSPSGTGGNIVFNGNNATRTGVYQVLVGGAVQTIDDGPVPGTVFGQVAGVFSALVQPVTYVAYRKNGQILTNRTGSITPFTFSPPAGVSSVQFVGDPDVGNSDIFFGGTAPIGVSVTYVKNGTLHGGVAVSTLGGQPDRIMFETPLGQPGPASVNWSGAVATNMSPVGIRYNEFFSDLTIPQGGAFSSFGTVSAGSPNLGGIDTHVAFVGVDALGQRGIYVQGHPYGLVPLIVAGDLLDGKIVQDVDLGRDSEFGVQIAFWASFTDGSSGVYFTRVPDPATGSIAGLLVLSLLRPLRRQR